MTGSPGDVSAARALSPPSTSRRRLPRGRRERHAGAREAAQFERTVVVKGPVPLHLIANGKGEELQEPAHHAAIPPPLVRDATRSREIRFEYALETMGDSLIVDHQVDLVVESEGPTVEIGAAHRGPATVHHHGLGVEEGRPVLVDLDPGLEQATELPSGRLLDDVAINGPGQEQDDPDAIASG